MKEKEEETGEGRRGEAILHEAAHPIGFPSLSPMVRPPSSMGEGDLNTGSFLEGGAYLFIGRCLYLVLGNRKK